MTDVAPRPAATQTSDGSGWRPLRTPAFRRLWTAQFVSNIGSWMQTVAAQWVMISLTRSALLIGAIQAAASIPALILAIPAGTLGDLFDRRKLILATQILMLVAATVLAVLGATGGLTPAVLLVLLFVIGCGVTGSAPTWQTLQPELVPEQDRAAAIALGTVNQNLARAVGPALGGALLAATSAALVFGVNAASFIAVVAAVMITRIPVRTSTLPREHAIEAMRAGGRFVANSPVLLSLIARAFAFILPAGATWALLPIVAHGRLHLGSGGYGLLLGCVGVGALIAATYGPAIRRLLSPRAIYAASAAIMAAGAAVLAVSDSVALDAFVLVAAGAAWITAIGLLGAAYQSSMPPWVKARGIAFYQVAFQGSNAIGALGFGALASATDVRTAFYAMAGLLVLALLTWPLPLPAPDPRNVAPVDAWPLPDVAGNPDQVGPVLVIVEWPVRPEAEPEFMASARDLRRLRRRTGAVTWRLYRSTVHDPPVLVETFSLGTWAEHERQHARIYPGDEEVLDRLDLLLEPSSARQVSHLTAVHRGSRRSRGGAGS
jgi:MFS family permease